MKRNMNIRNRIRRIEGNKQIQTDFCKCFEPVVKIFTNENRPQGYSSRQCFICRKTINLKKGKTTVIYPKNEVQN